MAACKARDGDCWELREGVSFVYPKKVEDSPFCLGKVPEQGNTSPTGAVQQPATLF